MNTASAGAVCAAPGSVCNTRATRGDVVDLYLALSAAVAGSEEFELLNAAFNRECSADPTGVLRAIEQLEAFG